VVKVDREGIMDSMDNFIEVVAINEENCININMTASIALSHHERWDGTGYPRGLKGEDIPLEGRIVSICDHYDALRSKRPYKPALSHQEAMEIIVNGDLKSRPGCFDPQILEVFIRIADEFDEIYVSQSD
jgi:putative two-component system response regulator